MKKCKYDYLYPRCNGFDGRKCPPGMLQGCVYPSKPRPKMKRIKAWAWKSKGVYGWCATELKPPLHLDGSPCTILIDRKYLKK